MERKAFDRSRGSVALGAKSWVRRWSALCVVLCIASFAWSVEPLRIEADFEGASIRDVTIDQAARSIRFMPGGDADRGWPCWWYFRIEGLTPGEPITLRLRASTATTTDPRSSLRKPLAAAWAMPNEAMFSLDGTTWRKTERGVREGDELVYALKPAASRAWVAWGPPFTPTDAERWLRELARGSNGATVGELCRSRGGRSVPMLHVREGDRPDSARFGVWVQARQHAWESGSSWVARGFAEWLLSDQPDAAWLRQQADIYVVPIMDVDNVATGNGGKDAVPHDHNRDWSESPHWFETRAAQQHVSALIEQRRMDVFLDLHNPAPGDPTFFYVLKDELLREPMIGLRNRFVELSYARISRIKPLIPMSNRPKVTGPEYHPRWRNISANWVALNGNPRTVSVCLETIWNYENCTTEGYRAVGANLAAATREFLAERRTNESP